MNLRVPLSSAFLRRSAAARAEVGSRKPEVGMAVVSASPLSASPAVTAAADPLTNASLATRWLRPSAQERWLAPSLRFYTPQMVELILRGALAGDLNRQQEMFKLMEETWPRLTANLKKLREKTCGLEWFVEAWAPKGEKPSAEAQRRAALFEDAIWNMRPDPAEDENEFEGTLFDVLDAWGCGLSVCEILWDTRATADGPLFVPRATRWVPPPHYGYDTASEEPDRLRLRASSVMDGAGEGDWLDFPADKFLIAVAKQKSGSPVGGALLRSLGFFWAAQNFSWEWFLNFAQLFGLPLRWANYSRSADADTIAQIETMLSTMGSAGWAAFPEGTTLQIIEAVKASAEGPHERLNAACDTVCDILILGQTLTSDVGPSGSRALGDVHAAVLSVREKAVTRFAARVLNTQLIPAFCRLNFGDDSECPYLVPDLDEEEDTKATADMLEVAKRLGVEIPVGFVHERLGIPLAKKGEPILPPTPAPAKLEVGSAKPEAGDPDPATESEAGDEPDAVAASHSLPTSGFRLPTSVPLSAERKLAAAVAESVTGVEAQWLGGAVPWFQRLIAAAQHPRVTDAEFEALVLRAQRNLPDELAPLLNARALATAMEAQMGAAVVNGAVNGWLTRKSQIGNRKSGTPAPAEVTR